MASRLFALSLALCAITLALVPALGNAVLVATALLVVAACRRPGQRDRWLALATGLVWGALAALAFALLTDNFALRYVWIYSGAELPAYLKFANLWGGDEGTTLLLAAVLLALARRPAARTAPGQATAWLAAWYLAVAAWLGPFAATPADWLAQKAAQGMNAHLMEIWMVLHAPLVLLAYAWTLALCAPALDALAGRLKRWPAGALHDARRAWALLTAGIGFGMIWAFEDAMYGQFWHWDPVQTAVFAVWCALGAHLHGARGWSARAGAWRWVPVWALLAAVFTVAAMAVTRNETLASSHRYIGTTSWRAHGLTLVALIVAGALAAWRGRAPAEPTAARPRAAPLNALALRLTQLCFVVLAVCAAAYLAWAFTASALGLPRPDHLRPFFETLNNWANRTEIPQLRAAFAQWDMDGYGAARGLIWPLACLGVVGGWFFMRRIAPLAGWLSLPPVLLAGTWVFLTGGPLTEGYRGTGVLSQSIVHLLPGLDVCLVAGAYLAIACALWALGRAWKTPSSAGYVLPLGLVHVGAILALWGGLMATALNGYSQHRIEVGEDWVHGYRGYQLRITEVAVERGDDGGARVSPSPYRAAATIEVKRPGRPRVSGQALYRDSRSALENYSGPVRQICEILDYRYSRYASVPGYVLHPFIEHGWGRDVQLWVNPAAIVAGLGDAGASREVVAVLRIFPFASWLWIGLTLMALASLWLGFLPPRKAKEPVA
ncbi:cytochrome c biogenesis protein CcsA [Nitrogeniibacter mangrovi]|uniref:Cytochrome c biogenesis protein CcsA n=1 Tax=Nitrogeniibacter mangrovi TaxID=2016596 RepID=A0A6C1AZL6_9RHOO|nr:cytochrome c biogenesis protein CcsA [Nitrogeniibacter mangrovi]QID16179.1 cytochrome c biogenesis protein CcsA [Nitrogeniibacter mangrovi]